MLYNQEKWDAICREMFGRTSDESIGDSSPQGWDLPLIRKLAEQKLSYAIATESAMRKVLADLDELEEVEI